MFRRSSSVNLDEENLRDGNSQEKPLEPTEKPTTSHLRLPSMNHPNSKSSLHSISVIDLTPVRRFGSFYRAESLNDHEEELARATALAVVAASERQSRTALTEVPLNLYHFSSEYTLCDSLGRQQQKRSTDAKRSFACSSPRNFLSSDPINRRQRTVDKSKNCNASDQKPLDTNHTEYIKKSQSFRGIWHSEKYSKRKGITRHASEHLNRPFKGVAGCYQPRSYGEIYSDCSKNKKLGASQKNTADFHQSLKVRRKTSKLVGNDSAQTTFPEMEPMGSSNVESEDYEGKPSQSLKEQFFSFFQPTDNKLAMKLFGTKNALNRERLRQEQHGKWIIHPCSNFRFYWDVIMLLLLIANLIILPVAISFFNEELTIQWIAFNCISDTVFLVDIVVNFRTGIIKNNFADEIVLNPKEIARHYVKTWFFMDLLSSLPLDYIYLIFHENDNFSQIVQAGRALRFLRFAKLLSLIKLLRLSRLVRYVSQWEEFLSVANKFIGIFNLVLLLLLLGHWNACLQFLVPMINEYPVDSWVSKVKLQKANWFEQYTWALFKAMSHMLSIGYGRYPPTSITEAWITLISMVTGATGYALFVGHAAALIQSFDCSKRLYREKFKQVNEYMAFRKLPRALRQRIASYYEHRYQGKMFNENEILNELSECLKEQIVNYNCRALVAAVPFFTFADQNFVSEVIIKLRYEVFQPGDLIIKEGTIGSKMYFIQEGIVDIVTRDGEIATSLSDGSYFGEICLLTNARRVASVRAETYCNVYSLDRVSFLEVLDNYPLMRRTMESVAAERLNKIGRDPLVVSKRKDLYDDLKLVNEIVNQAITEASDTEAEAPVPKLKKPRHKLRARLLRAHQRHHRPCVLAERRKSVMHSIQRAFQHFQSKAHPTETCNSGSSTSTPEKRCTRSSDLPPAVIVTSISEERVPS